MLGQSTFIDAFATYRFVLLYLQTPRCVALHESLFLVHFLNFIGRVLYRVAQIEVSPLHIFFSYPLWLLGWLLSLIFPIRKHTWRHCALLYFLCTLFRLFNSSAAPDHAIITHTAMLSCPQTLLKTEMTNLNNCEHPIL